MSVWVLDGPEAAGKTTLIRELQSLIHPTPLVRQWGPVDSWMAYLDPMMQDIRDPEKHVIWDRSWAAEYVYNILLERGHPWIDDAVRKYLERPVIESGGALAMVYTPDSVLTERRLKRVEAGDKDDLAVDPAQELHAFQGYAYSHGWGVTSGTGSDVREAAIFVVQMARGKEWRPEE